MNADPGGVSWMGQGFTGVPRKVGAGGVQKADAVASCGNLPGPCRGRTFTGGNATPHGSKANSFSTLLVPGFDSQALAKSRATGPGSQSKTNTKVDKTKYGFVTNANTNSHSG